MQEQIHSLSQNIALLLIIVVSLFFTIIGILYSKKHQNLSSYLTANRNIGTLPLTTSLVASALGSWILFGPSAAATWGGMGSVIGYSLGAACPMISLVFLGEKIRKVFPKGNTITEFIYKKFGKNLFKLIIILTIFYLFIFLCAEVTAVSMLVNYISGTSLWLTAIIIIVATLTYTLYGGLRASILTDNLQFFIVFILIFICIYYLISDNSTNLSFEVIKKSSEHLVSFNYIPNYTAGLTFFIAVAATNLFHQGNWQRVFAAKNTKILKRSLLLSFFIIVPTVFFMGFMGMFAISIDNKINPDLAFFSILLRDNKEYLSVVIVILATSLTVSTLDTLVNAISSLLIVDGKKFYKLSKNENFLKKSKIFIVIISIISFIIASKGFSILYLFLLADLLCCAAVLTVFLGFYEKDFKEEKSILSILVGLFFGLLLFPSPDFSKSILVGIIFSKELFPKLLTESLLFWSFFVATITPLFFRNFNRKFNA